MSPLRGPPHACALGESHESWSICPLQSDRPQNTIPDDPCMVYANIWGILMVNVTIYIYGIHTDPMGMICC